MVLCLPFFSACVVGAAAFAEFLALLLVVLLLLPYGCVLVLLRYLLVSTGSRSRSLVIAGFALKRGPAIYRQGTPLFHYSFLLGI